MPSYPPRIPTRLRVAALSAAGLLAAACGSSGGGGGGGDPVPVDISVSDAAVGDLAAVVVTLDRVTIDRPGFPAEDPGDPDTDTITFDLLDYQGMDRLLIVDGVMLEPGSYQNLRLHVVENESYVEEADGDIKPIKAPSRELKFGGFTVAGDGPQAFVVEFPLMHAMTYNPGPPGPDRYILKPRGLRIVDVEQGATLAGTVDPSLFDAGDGCDAKSEPDEGNVVYLYRGHGLDIDALGDLFDPDLDPDAAADLAEPYAAESVAADGDYLFSFLPAGAYTVAFACDAADDDPEFDDGIWIPNPADEWMELRLDVGEDGVCDFPIGGGGCL